MIDRLHEKPNEAAALAPRTFNVAVAKNRYGKARTPKSPDEKSIFSPEEATKQVKVFAKNIGADLVGTAESIPCGSILIAEGSFMIIAFR